MNDFYNEVKETISPLLCSSCYNPFQEYDLLEAIFDMPEMNAIRNLLIYEYITPSIQHGLDTETVIKLAHKWMTERHLLETVIDWVVKDFKGKL